MKFKSIKKFLLILGLSVLTAGGAITAPLASNATPVIAATVNSTLTANNFLGARPITPITYETKLSSGKYVIKKETVNKANLPLLTTTTVKKIIQTKNGSFTVSDGDIRFVKINDKTAWRYVYGGVVQTKFSGWVHNSVTGAKPDFIKFTNGLVDVTATNKGCSEPLQISISNLSNIGFIGTKYKLTPTLSPDISGKITWSSSNTSIATVNSSGIVSFLKKGAVNITAKLDSGAYSTLYMKVYDVEDEDMRFNNAGQIGSILPNLYIGTTKQLTAETVKNSFPVKFVNTGSSSIPFVQATWKSSDTKILTVNQSGLVKGVSAGKATVTATTKKGKTIKATIEVSPILALKIEFEKGNKNTILYLNGKETLKTIISPSTTTNKKVTYSSSNTKVATVSSTGEVKAVGHGYAYITAKTSNGKTAQHKVYVVKKDGIYKEGNNYYYYKDDKKSTLTGVIYGELDNDDNSYGPWYLKNGKVDFTFTGFAKERNDWLYFEKGYPCYFRETLKEGTINGKKGLYYINGGSAFDTRKTGFAKYGNDWWYVEKGVVTKKYNGKVKGTIDGKTDTFNVVNSKVELIKKINQPFTSRNNQDKTVEGYIYNGSYSIKHFDTNGLSYTKITGAEPQIEVLKGGNAYTAATNLTQKGAKVIIDAGMQYDIGMYYANNKVYSYEQLNYRGNDQRGSTLVLRNNGYLDDCYMATSSTPSQLGVKWALKGLICMTYNGNATPEIKSKEDREVVRPFSFIAQDYDGVYYVGATQQNVNMNKEQIHNTLKTLIPNLRFSYATEGGGHVKYFRNGKINVEGGDKNRPMPTMIWFK